MEYETNLMPRDFLVLSQPTGSIYETVAIIAKRARQIAVKTKEELDNKLAEFLTEGLEERETDHSNIDLQEQAKIARLYETMPKPTTIAIEEFLEGKLLYRHLEAEES